MTSATVTSRSSSSASAALSARLDRGAAAEDEMLDRALGYRGQREDDRQAFHAYELPRSLAGGIGAVRPFPPSRRRSILPSEFASASPATSEGSDRATVTGMLAEARSSPSGASPIVEHPEAARDHPRLRAARRCRRSRVPSPGRPGAANPRARGVLGRRA